MILSIVSQPHDFFPEILNKAILAALNGHLVRPIFYTFEHRREHTDHGRLSQQSPIYSKLPSDYEQIQNCE